MYLVYHINKGLGLVRGEPPNYIGLTAVRENLCDKRDALIYCEGQAD